jgi:hypothetical protein
MCVSKTNILDSSESKKKATGCTSRRREDSAMSFKTSHLEQERWRLPASSWWIPSLTAAVAVLAVVTALV